MTFKFRHFLFIFLIVLSGCESKEGLTTVEGVVKDINGKVLTNHPVKIESNLWMFTDMGGSDKDAKLSTLTDSIGKYSFSFFSKKDYYYKVLALETNCYFKNLGNIEAASNNTVDLILDAKGVVRLRLNSNLIGDSISYKFINEEGSELYRTNFRINSNISNYKMILDVEIDQNTIIDWNIFSKNGNLHNSVSVRPNQCDTVTYEIKK